VTEHFIEMFANSDSLRLPRDVRRALGVLCAQVVDCGFADAVPPLDIVHGKMPKASSDARKAA
jgi:hypothetical protein